VLAPAGADDEDLHGCTPRAAVRGSR
jgi:hypothetical protein